VEQASDNITHLSMQKALDSGLKMFSGFVFSELLPAVPWSVSGAVMGLCGTGMLNNGSRRE
jgi:hypothetical protein